MLGYDLEDVAFLLGVALLWFLIGKWLDRRRFDEVSSENRMAMREILISMLLVALGLSMGTGLFYEGVHGLRIPLGRFWWTIAESILFLVWSIVLIIASGLTITRVICGVAQHFLA